MHKFILIFSLLIKIVSISNGQVYVGLQSYFVSKNDYYDNGVAAWGPSINFVDQKFSMQLGIMFDMQNYYYYEYVGHFGPATKVDYLHLYVPIALQYRPIKIKMFDVVVSGGILVDKYDEDFDSKLYIAPIAGLGLEYREEKFLFRLIPSCQFVNDNDKTRGIFGLVFDVAFTLGRPERETPPVIPIFD